MIPFEKWIRQGPGRCPGCGWHTTKQGHGPDCPTRERKP